MEGKEVRFGIANSALFATVTHRCVVRRRQFDARQLYAAWAGWSRCSTSSLGRDHRRRRRRRPLRHAAVCHPRVCSVPATDGRPHASEYSWQYKKIEAKEVKMAMLAHPHPPAVDPRLLRPLPPSPPPGIAGPANAGSRMASVRSSMPTPRPPATTVRAFAGISAQYHVLQHDHRPSRCSSALPDDRADGRDRGIARSQEDRACLGRYLPDSNGPLFVRPEWSA